MNDYDTDLVVWSERQAGLLRIGVAVWGAVLISERLGRGRPHAGE